MWSSSLSLIVLITSALMDLCCCAMNPKPEIRLNSVQHIDIKTKKPSGPNDFIGQSLVDPLTQSFYKDPLMADSGESFERESFDRLTNIALKENLLLKQIVDNYNPEQGWNFLNQEKIDLIHLAINEHKEEPRNLRIKHFLQAIVKQLNIPANLYFLEFGDVKNFYDEIMRLNLN